MFAELSWLQVMQGQGIEPRGYHPFADKLPQQDLLEFMANVKDVIKRCVKVMPDQADFIKENCAAGRP